MQKINKACRAVLLTAMVFAAGAGMVQAAGGWEWTQGQGWVMGAGVSRPTAREQLHYAYELEQRGEFMDSARQYFLLIQNFPDSNEAGVGLQRLARCLFEMENYYTAYNAIEQVIKTYPGTGRMSDLVEIELRIAKKLMLSETPDLLSDNSAGSRVANVRRALEIIDSVISHDPFGPVAAEAYLVKGEGNLFINELATAREAFEVVQDQFPRSDFVERARLGVLRCDSLIGQARPQEVYEQVQVVREAEAERQRRGFAGDEEFDDVSESLRQLAEVEAAKMMDQAEQYRRMGTREAVQASEFLYKEIARRFPGTPQADDANDRLGNLRIPREQGRIVKSLRQIKLNPFTWNKDPEPPWIVPQLDPEDMVMLDPGLGPIAGVPETGVPATAGAPGVRPAALDSNAAVNLDMDGLGDLAGPFGPSASSAPFSPAGSGPAAGPGGSMPAPPFVDATSGTSGVQTYSSDPDYFNSSAAQAAARSPFLADPSQPAPYGAGQGYSPASPAPLPYDPSGYAAAPGGMAPYQPAPSPGLVDLPPSRPSFSATANPIPSISEDDLISLDGPSQPTLAAAPQYQVQPYQPAPAPAPMPMNQDTYINTYGGGYTNYPSPDQYYMVEPVQPYGTYSPAPAPAPYSQPQTAYAPPAPYAQPQPNYAQPPAQYPPQPQAGYGQPLDQQPRIGSIQDAPLTDLVGMSNPSYVQPSNYAQPATQPQPYADPYASTQYAAAPYDPYTSQPQMVAAPSYPEPYPQPAAQAGQGSWTLGDDFR